MKPKRSRLAPPRPTTPVIKPLRSPRRPSTGPGVVATPLHGSDSEPAAVSAALPRAVAQPTAEHGRQGVSDQARGIGWAGLAGGLVAMASLALLWWIPASSLQSSDDGAARSSRSERADAGRSALDAATMAAALEELAAQTARQWRGWGQDLGLVAPTVPAMPAAGPVMPAEPAAEPEDGAFVGDRERALPRTAPSRSNILRSTR